MSDCYHQGFLITFPLDKDFDLADEVGTGLLSLVLHSPTEPLAYTFLNLLQKLHGQHDDCAVGAIDFHR